TAPPNPWRLSAAPAQGGNGAAPAAAGNAPGGAAPSASAPSNQAPVLPPINVLLVGTDNRDDHPAPPRADTLMLLTLDRATQTAGMLSLPRDLWVPIPSYNMTYK